jgi:hypothetical protein
VVSLGSVYFQKFLSNYYGNRACDLDRQSASPDRIDEPRPPCVQGNPRVRVSLPDIEK